MEDIFVNLVLLARENVRNASAVMPAPYLELDGVIATGEQDEDALTLLHRLLVIHRYDLVRVMGNLNDLIIWSAMLQVKADFPYIPLYREPGGKHVRPQYVAKRFKWDMAKVQSSSIEALWWTQYIIRVLEGESRSAAVQALEEEE